MLYPDKLKKGYKIGVTAPSAGFSSAVDVRRLENGIRHFQSLGYPVKVTDNVKRNDKGRSSSGSVRAKELLELVRDTEVRAVFAATGGDYLVEMLPYLDYDVISSNPKWFQGFSDTTGLLFMITTNLDMATLYANNFSAFGMKNWHSSLADNLRILEGEDIIQHSFPKFQDGYKPRITGYEEFALEEKVNWVNVHPKSMNPDRELHIKGRALVGCLDVLLTLVGTKFDRTKEFVERYKEDRILWFLESYDLGAEALTRGLWQLREAGWFEHAAGFVFGRPAMFHTDTDVNYLEAVLSILGDFNLPIILEADIGHKPPQFTMMNGAIAEIRSYGGGGSIIFERR